MEQISDLAAKIWIYQKHTGCCKKAVESDTVLL